MKTILVPTDFSKSADNALNYAVSIAKKLKARIIIFHAYNVTYVSQDMPIEYYAQQVKDTEFEVKQLLMSLRNRVKKTAKIECGILALQGLEVATILEIIKHKRVNLVVMGSKGAGGIKEKLIGSNTSKVVESSEVPVIAVPDKAQFQGITRVVFATDYKDGDVNCIKKLMKLIGPFKPEIHLIHITHKKADAENETMAKFIKMLHQKMKYERFDYALVQGDQAEHALAKYLKKKSADMLAISIKHKNLFVRLFGESISKKLVYHSKVPLITLYHK